MGKFELGAALQHSVFNKMRSLIITATSLFGICFAFVIPVELFNETFAPNGDKPITFSRTIDSVSGASGSVTLDHGCTGSDEYGSNDCAFGWGQKVSANLNVTMAKDITSGTISVDAHVDGLIP